MFFYEKNSVLLKIFQEYAILKRSIYAISGGSRGGDRGDISPPHQTFGLPVFRIHSDYYFYFSYYIFNHVFDL